MVSIGEVEEEAEGVKKSRGDRKSRVSCAAVEPFDAPEQAVQLRGLCDGVWETVLNVHVAHCCQVDLDRLWLDRVGEVGGE